MKITKRQLRRIIREEKSKVLKEQKSPARMEAARTNIHNGLDRLLEEVETLSVQELEYIANHDTGSDLDEATRSLARIALANVATQYGPYRGG